MFQTVTTFLDVNRQLSATPRNQDGPIQSLLELREPIGARESVSILTCRRAGCLYLKRRRCTHDADINLLFSPAKDATRCCTSRTLTKMSNQCPVNKEVETFKRSSLKRTEVKEKNPLPTTQVIDDEKVAIKEKSMKVPLNSELEDFSPDKLKKTETQEKNPLPTVDVINDEKIAIKEKSMKVPLNSELEDFSPNMLKKTETHEKNPLPTVDVIKEEKIAIEEKCMKEPLNNELEEFNAQKLKKTQTKEKNPLPTAKEIEAEKKAQKQNK